MFRLISPKFALAFFFLFVVATTAHAQATRTWVSGVGDDVNPCSRTAPCKTFAGAISKTAAGGIINALDPGAYGTVTITKSITIDAGGMFAGVLATGSVNGIIVNAGATDVVVLRGLSINGAGSGLNGVSFIAGGTLHIEDCTIQNFSANGVLFEPAGTSQLTVKDSFIRNNGTAANTTGGVRIKPTGTGFANVAFDKVRMDRNVFGIRAEDNSRVNMRDSFATVNTNNGFIAVSNAAVVELTLDNCLSSNNGTNGVASVGPDSTVRMTRTTISNNATGLLSSRGGQIMSFGNNYISGNTVNGAPTGFLSPQ